jgi:L-aspartate oxidase
LKEALGFIEERILSKDVGHLLKLRALSAKEIVKSALNRKESVGAHYIEGEE